MSAAVQKVKCQTNLIAAFVDGELETHEARLFEEHLANCEECREELRMHQLFVCELDAALTHKEEVTVPADFSRMVAARAVSDMRGVRSRSEHRKALIFSLVLAVSSFTLLGTSTSQLIIVVVQRAVGKAWALIGLVWATAYDVLASVVVIARVISRRFVIEPRKVGLLLVLLAVAVFLLSRLLSKYHRVSASD
jgi:anti-sigma factor RsiW